MIVTILLAVAGILAVIALVRSRLGSLEAWAALLIVAALLWRLL